MWETCYKSFLCKKEDRPQLNHVPITHHINRTFEEENMKMTIIYERMTPEGDGRQPAIFALAESRASWHICIIVCLYVNKTYDQSINQSSSSKINIQNNVGNLL